MPNISRFAVGSARSLGLNATVSSENWVLGFLDNGLNPSPKTVFSTNSEYYVGGYTYPLSGGAYSWVFKTNFNGVVDPAFRITLPLTTNPNNYNTTIVDIAVDTTNNLLYVLLNGTLISNGNVYVWLIKYDLTTGTVSLGRQSSVTASTTTRGSKIQLSSDKSALYVLYNNATNYFVSKVATSTFSVTWTRYLSGTPTLSDMVVDSSDNVYVAGYQTVSSATTGLIVSWDSSGTLRWKKIDDPLNSLYYYRYDKIALTSNETYVWVQGLKYDPFGTDAVQVAHYTSNGDYGFSSTAYQQLDGTSIPSYNVVPSFTDSSSINRVFINGFGSPDGISVYSDTFSYKLQFTDSGNISPTYNHIIGVNTLRQRYVVPFSRIMGGSKGYVAALLGSGDIANGTYGIFTIDNASATTDNKQFNTSDSTLTSTSTTGNFNTAVSFTPGTLTLTSETLTPLP